jgi:hypothetical protein
VQKRQNDATIAPVLTTCLTALFDAIPETEVRRAVFSLIATLAGEKMPASKKNT